MPNLKPGCVSRAFCRSGWPAASSARPGAISAMEICVIGLLAAIVAGCVNQNQEIAEYRTILDGRVTPTTSPARGDELTLIEAMHLAARADERLDIQGEDYLQALIERDRAAWNFLPRVNLLPTYQINKIKVGGSGTNTSGVDVGAGSGSRRTRFDFPADASVNLFNGFRDVNTLGRNAHTAEQRKSLLIDLQEQVLLEAARAFYQVIISEQSVGVLQDSLRLQETRLDEAHTRARIGAGTELEIAQTEAQVAGTRTTLIGAQSDVRQGRAVLAFLTGLHVQGRRLVVDLDNQDPIAVLARSQELALESRQDLQAADEALLADYRNVEIAVGAFYPSVQLDFKYFLKRETQPTDNLWTALVSANAPIFSAGDLKADLRRAWSLLRQSKLRRDRLVRQIEQDVAVAYEQDLSSSERLANIQTQVRAAAEALRQSEENFRVGRATNLDRLTSQNTLLNAQLDYTSEISNNKLLYLNLQRVMGRLGNAVQK